MSEQGRVSRGVAWVGLASAIVAVCDLVSVAVILRYWASTTDYGSASLVMTTFGALLLIGEAGLPAALVQRDHADPDRMSTAFWLGLMFGVALYGVIYLAAPLAGRAFDAPEMVSLFRGAGLLLVIRAFYTTHQAMLRKELRFKELSYVRIIANVVEVTVKIGTAAAGWGLWCFVLGPLARETVYAIGVPIAARWWPRWVFRPRELADDFRFGIRANAGELLYQIYSNLDYQVVGYYFGKQAVGLYKAAYELVLEPVKFVSGVVTVVAFPAFAKLRNDRAALVAQLVAFTRQNLAVVLVFVVLITVTADDMLFAVFGKEYVAAAHAGRILAVVGAFRALSFLGPPLLDGMGHSGKSLRYQTSAAIILSTAFVIAANLGSSMDAVAIAWAVGYPLAFFVLARLVLAQLDLGGWAFLRPFARLALIPLVGGACGIVARVLANDAAPLTRLAITSATIIVVSIAGLVIFEDYSPRAIIKRLRA